MADTTRLTLDFDSVAVLRDMARHYLDTTTAEAEDDESRRQLIYERGIAGHLYEQADAAIKRMVAHV